MLDGRAYVDQDREDSVLFGDEMVIGPVLAPSLATSSPKPWVDDVGRKHEERAGDQRRQE